MHLAKDLVSPSVRPACQNALEVLHGIVALIDYTDSQGGNRLEGASREAWLAMEHSVREKLASTDPDDTYKLPTKALLFDLVEIIRHAQRSGEGFVLDNEQEWQAIHEEARPYEFEYSMYLGRSALSTCSSPRATREERTEAMKVLDMLRTRAAYRASDDQAKVESKMEFVEPPAFK